jgi:hypothetical protein
MNKKFIIISLILISSFGSMAQNDLERKIFIRPGIDLSRFVVPYVNDIGPSGLELSVDAEYKYNFFPTIEIGFSKLNDNTEEHNYELHGNYFRAGLNYSITKYKHRLDRDIFFVGARYGFSSFSHQASKISFSNQWGVYEGALPETNLSAHWFEGVIGLRVEFFDNMFMGYTLRIKTMITHSDYGNYTPYWVPGYGEGTKSMAVGMSYSLFYSIPIKKFKYDFEE